MCKIFLKILHDIVKDDREASKSIKIMFTAMRTQYYKNRNVFHTKSVFFSTELEMTEPKIHMTTQGTKNVLGIIFQTWWKELLYLLLRFILE